MSTPPAAPLRIALVEMCIRDSYGFVLWLPSILKHGANIDIIEAGWLSALPYLAAVIAMLGVSWASDRLQKRKRFVWPPLLIASIAFYGSYALGSEHFWLSYALLVLAGACMYAPYGPFFAIVPEVLPACLLYTSSGNAEQIRLDSLAWASRRGHLAYCEAMVQRCMADYDIHGWLRGPWQHD